MVIPFNVPLENDTLYSPLWGQNRNQNIWQEHGHLSTASADTVVYPGRCKMIYTHHFLYYMPLYRQGLMMRYEYESPHELNKMQLRRWANKGETKRGISPTNPSFRSPSSCVEHFMGLLGYLFFNKHIKTSNGFAEFTTKNPGHFNKLAFIQTYGSVQLSLSYLLWNIKIYTWKITIYRYRFTLYIHTWFFSWKSIGILFAKIPQNETDLLCIKSYN